jgi:hypothetical protein
MDNDREESIAIDRLVQLKDLNVKRHADVMKLKSRMQTLQSDIQILHTSHKLKL